MGEDLRFYDEEGVRRWYDSPEYQELAQHHWRFSRANIVLVRGML